MPIHLDSCPICEGTNFSAHVKAKDFWVSQESFNLLKCNSCALVFTQDAPDENEIASYYQHESYISHTDTAVGFTNRIYHKVRDIMLRRKAKIVANHTKKGKVLEVGAGTGYFLSTMIKNGWEGVGVEPDTGAAAVAKEKFGLSLYSTLKEVVAANQEFKAITMWHVLEHVHNLNGYFEKFNELLAEDGALVIAVPNYTSYDATFYGKEWAAYDVPKHLWHFCSSSMSVLAQKHGFKVAKEYMLPYDSYYISMLSETHRGNKFFGKIRAMFVGEISYLLARFNVKKSSSVVYILKKNNV